MLDLKYSVDGEGGASSETATDMAPAGDPTPAVEAPVQQETVPSAAPAAPAQQAPAFDYDKMSIAQARAMAEAIKPLIPKPPESPKDWENDQVVMEAANKPSQFMGLIGKQTQHLVNQSIEPIRQQLQQIVDMLPTMYASRAENPNYNAIQSRANEIVQSYQIPWGIALRMASDEVSKKPITPNVKTPPPPGYASSPETGNIPDAAPREKGPANFASILKDLRAGK